MMKVRKIIGYFIFFTLMFLTSFYLFNNSMTLTREKELRQHLEISIAGLDVDRLERINRRLLEEEDVVNIISSEDFTVLRRSLFRIQNSFPVRSYWIYILMPIDQNHEILDEYDESDTWVLLSVPTVVPIDLNVPESLPGYVYRVTEFPEIMEVINGSDFGFSNVPALDEEYDVYVQTAVYRIENDKGDFIGILGIDRGIDQFIGDLISSAFASFMYSLLAMSLTFIAIKSRIFRHYQYEKKDCEDKD